MRRYSDRGFRTNINDRLITLPKKICQGYEFEGNNALGNHAQIPLCSTVSQIQQFQSEGIELDKATDIILVIGPGIILKGYMLFGVQ